VWPHADILLIQADIDEEVEVPPVDNPDSPSTGLHHLVDVTRFSRFTKLLVVTAYVCRFFHNTRQPDLQWTGPLTTSELTQANLKWIHDIQHAVFTKEIANIQSRHNRLPLVRQLKLFLDSNNLLQCGGRIHNAPLSELHVAKFPYLLPSRHHFITLVFQNTHTTQLHSGVNTTLTTLKAKLLDPVCSAWIKSIFRKCVACKKTSGQPYTIPDPPPLVKSRVCCTDPFTVTGVDFTGALYIRAQDGECKVYICFFTCAVFYAVHLEIVLDSTVDSFLQAFHRFVGRSAPKLPLSDNGSIFVAAAEELKTLFTSTELSEALARKGIEWKFLPKQFGGFWECLIGLTKNTLKKTLGRTHVTLESLQTIVVKVEALLNDWPLTYASSDISDPEPITPPHLLRGRKIITLLL